MDRQTRKHCGVICANVKGFEHLTGEIDEKQSLKVRLEYIFFTSLDLICHMD